MENAIDKLMWEYTQKITACDALLGEISVKKSSLRRKIRDEPDKCSDEQEELLTIKKEEIRLDAQRQCYVQAKHDFDSLLDKL